MVSQWPNFHSPLHNRRRHVGGRFGLLSTEVEKRSCETRGDVPCSGTSGAKRGNRMFINVDSLCPDRGDGTMYIYGRWTVNFCLFFNHESLGRDDYLGFPA